MKQNVLLFCDSEVDYAQQISAYLTKDKSFPWTVRVCTKKEEMEYLLDEKLVQILVVAESFVDDELPDWPVDKMLILNESGLIHWAGVNNIDKYQDADCVKRELLRLFPGWELGYPPLNCGKKARIVSFYSPVGRCLQSSLAITYGQLLAETNRVLYLNFEYYSLLWEEDEADDGTDMATLLYCRDIDENRFEAQLRAMRKSIGSWDYITPIRNVENLTEAEGEDWIRLLEKCRMLQEYDVIILDLSDSLQGLFELLKLSDQIFTILKKDEISCKKHRFYEYVVEKKGCKCVLDKTRQVFLPLFDRLPHRLEDYCLGELADYVRNHLLLGGDHGLRGMEECSSG